MEVAQPRRKCRRRAGLRRLAAAGIGAVVVVSVAGCYGARGPRSAAREAPRTPPPRARPPAEPARPAVSERPPQFVVVSFDGSGGDELWPYWREVARRGGAHFTFFVSGVYLLDEARRELYRPPRHSPGSSDIGFAHGDGRRSAREIVRATLRQIAAGYREGHEIGTHYNGHFCAGAAGSVGEWDLEDWIQELDQFDRLLFHASANNHLEPAFRLPFGPREIAGGRTPCLEGKLLPLYRMLALRRLRYDASEVAVLGAWPRRRLGLWSVPLLEIPLVGHTYRVISMDYNFFANQTGAVSGPASVEPAVERETYLSLRNAFRTTYLGNRAPLVIGQHFETWNHWAYNRALRRFVLEKCHMPEVRCVSFRELVDWLEAQPPARLQRYVGGRFPRFTRALLDCLDRVAKPIGASC